MYFFSIMLLLLPSVSPAGLDSDVFKNKLHFGYGVNFKFNGQLYHNLDRVWVVHRVSLPQAEALEALPNFPENLDCYLSLREHNIPGSDSNLNRKQFLKQLCEITVPNFELIKKQAAHFRHTAHKLISEELPHALHGLPPIFETRYHKKRALPYTETLLANASVTYPPSGPKSRQKRVWAAIGAAALPALGKLATLAVEELGGYLQRKRNRALHSALTHMENELELTKNMMHQLKQDFLLYGEYEVNSTETILNMFNNIDQRTSTLEYWIEGGHTNMAQSYFSQLTGPTMYSHQLQLYLNSLEEKYVRLYEALVTELRLLLRSIAILSKGHLPPQLFPPSTLKEISELAIRMIGKENPDYVLALPHITDYYDMKLVTFALDEEDRLIICFPIFVKDYNKEAMTLYQIETVKVPIVDKNPNASSYTELSIQKPYIASNKAYYIQLVIT